MAQKWHLTHEATSCWLLLTLRVARKRFPSTGPPLSSQQKLKKQEHQRLMLELATRVFQEALGTPFAIRTTHRSVIFTVAASIILKLGGRRDLILRTALRMAGEPGEPYVPTFVRDAGNHMLVMLWSVTRFLHTIKVLLRLTLFIVETMLNCQKPLTILLTRGPGKVHRVSRSTAGRPTATQQGIKAKSGVRLWFQLTVSCQIWTWTSASCLSSSRIQNSCSHQSST